MKHAQRGVPQGGTFRAPVGDGDFLNSQQVNMYFSLLHVPGSEVLDCSDFAVHAKTVFSDLCREGGHPGQEGSFEEAEFLRTAVLSSLQCICSMHTALQPALGDGHTARHVADAFRGSPWGKAASRRIGCEEFPQFVRFLVAYWMHCYFETSCLPERAPANGAGADPTPTSAKAQSRNDCDGEAPAPSVLPLEPEPAAIRTQPPSVIFVVGGPGSGRTTQCSRIASHYMQDAVYDHLDAYSLLAEEAQVPGSAAGATIAEHLEVGSPPPEELVVEVLRRAMEARGWGGGRYVISGFPQTRADLEHWQRVIGDQATVQFVIAFDCSRATMEDRLEGMMTKTLCQPGLERRPSSDLLFIRQSQDAKTLQLHYFWEEWRPLLTSLEQRGLLRLIDGDQDVEKVWICVLEVLQMESQPLKNYAVVHVKAHASNTNTDRFVKSYLASRGIAVLQTGSVACKELRESGVFDEQYSQIIKHASADPRTLIVSGDGAELFCARFGITWVEAVREGRVLSAASAISETGINPEQLYTAWAGRAQVRLAKDIQVAAVPLVGGKFVVNGFVPHWRQNLTSDEFERLTWYAVEFHPDQMPWRRFRDEVLGGTNPAEAKEQSIRGQFYKYWQRLGLKAKPDTQFNCVHTSSGPMEGLREWVLWTMEDPAEHPVYRSLRASGVPEDVIKAWMQDPDVRDWPCSDGSTRTGPLFDCSNEQDHSDFRRSAVRHLCGSAGTSASGVQPGVARMGSKPWGAMEQSPARLARTPSKGWARETTPRSSHTPSKGWARQVSRSTIAEDFSRPEVITILHFNDVYNVEPRKKEPVGGIARFVTRVRELKEEAMARGEPTAMVLFSGDAFNPSLTSTVTQGKHMVPALNAVGIDVACYGNHDFDFGIGELVTLASETNFPWLLSNALDKETGEPLGQGGISKMVDWHGRKIGFLGLIEQEWLVTLHTVEPEGVLYEHFVPCGRRIAGELREAGAELVIALTHMRVPNDELLADEVEEIDLILGGHDHHYDVKPVGKFGTYVLKSGTDFRDITEVQLRFRDAGTPKSFEVLRTRHIEINSSVTEDPEMKSLSDACLEQLGASMDNVVGETAVDLDARFQSIRTMETNVGNFITDIMRDGLKTDVAMINSGTLRADGVIEKGKICMRDLVSLLPMLDEMCVLEVSADQLVALLQNSVAKYPRLEGRFLQVSGVTFAFDASKEEGNRLLLETIEVGGEPLDSSRCYTICTLNFLRQGKDGFDAFREAKCIADGEQTGVLPTLIRDHFSTLSALNGYGNDAVEMHRTRKATKMLERRTSLQPERIGDVPGPLQTYAIRPQVEGRIVCINPVAAPP